MVDGEGLRDPVTKNLSDWDGKLRPRGSNLIKSCKLQLGSRSWDSSRSENSEGVEPVFQVEVGILLGRSL